MELRKASVEFGEKLKLLREQRRVTQSELARKLGVTQQTVASWECGRTEPNIQSIKAMAEIFEVGVQTFFYKQEDDFVSEPLNTEFYVIQKNARRMSEAEMAKMFNLLRLSFDGYDWDVKHRRRKTMETRA
jgi:transcriptional regulator with XRE-family HTH domain